MYRKEDYIVLAILWRKSEERQDFLDMNNVKDVDWAEIKYPRIQRTGLAKFALFHEGTLQGLYDSREEAWDGANNFNGYVRVVDVPITELETPEYKRYYYEGHFNKPDFNETNNSTDDNTHTDT